MNIAVLSGKGGTGKTNVSVNLSSVIKNCTYIDCDVEEPNGHLFFRPENVISDKVYVSVPQFDEEKCVGCRKCVDFCEFNALAFIRGKIRRFTDICHACGGCKIICTQNAVFEKDIPVGEIKRGSHEGISVVSGVMYEGVESGVPVIRELLKGLSDTINIIDCPPGSGCNVMECVKSSDYCILVAEPTIFGVHNFLMVHQLTQLLEKPFGVIINKEEDNNNPMARMCREKGIPVIMSIAYSGEIAKSNAEGVIASEYNPKIRKLFEKLRERIFQEVGL